MPFKSKDQVRKFEELLSQGKISQATFDEWNKDTDHSKLPERIHQKKTKVLGVTDFEADYKRRFKSEK